MRRLPQPVLGALLIGLVTIVSYGVLVSQLGFYRDDWYLLATAQSEGSSGVIALFQIDRPLIGFLYAAAYRLLGMSPLAWQLTALILRLAGNLVFWWLLRLLWPNRPAETLAAALLFSVYPGYSVQPNAGVYSTDLLASASVLLSFVIMLKAVQARRASVRITLLVLAAMLELLYLGIFESAIGLEVARLGVLWYCIWRRDRLDFQRTSLAALKADLLYILVAAAFLVWRLFIFQSTRRATNLDVLVGRYAALPIRSTLGIAIETIKDVFETAILAWTVPFYQSVAASNYRDLAVALVLALAVGIAAILVLRTVTFAPPAAGRSRQANVPLHMLALGGLVVLFALLPIDLAGRNVLFTDQWDRYTLYASSGVALVIAGAIFRFLSPEARKPVLVALICMSTVVHYFSAAWYRDFWAVQRDLWQQLVWRAPGIRSGTMLFAALPVGGYQEGYEIYGPANMIYYPHQSLKIGGDVINPATATDIFLQKDRQHYDRSVLIADNFRNPLIAVFPERDSCLHVLDGRKVELPGPPDDSVIAEVAAYSRIEMIDTTATAAALPSFLGGQVSRPWCRYYQQMDLARQRGNWSEVAELADEALTKDITPEDVSEWMPALEAYATLGRLQDMRRTAAIIRSSDPARAFLCLQIQRGAAYPPPYDYNQVNQALCQAN